MKRIALIGDYNKNVVAHRAIPIALGMSVEALQADVSWDWLHTRTLTGEVQRQLEPYAGVWCVPGSPYENAAGAIAAIRFARETLLEYAQSIWGVAALHAESNANGSDPVIAPLMCALVDVKGPLHFAPGSRLAQIYGAATATEEYHCSFGLNPLYVDRLDSGPLKIAARDDDGSVRAVELDNHPFFIATLFQPERAALRGRLPPLVRAFMTATACGRD
jgi:CTP synthase (UTP-ammonia lyase)